MPKALSCQRVRYVGPVSACTQNSVRSDSVDDSRQGVQA